MTTQRNFVRLGITSSAFLGTAFFPQLAPVLGMVEAGQNLGSLGVLFGCMASVAGGNVASALDALTSGKDPDWVNLENEDLTRAVGKAIASVLMWVAREYQPKTGVLQTQEKAKVYHHLSKVARSAAEHWLDYLRREDYSVLKEENIEAIITPVLAENPASVLVTPTDWLAIFSWLNRKAKPNEGYSFPTELKEKIAEALTEHFPKALLQVLKEDFARDGKAYAALSLKLLTGLRTQLASPGVSGIDPTLKTDILARVGELEEKLTAEATATFRVLGTQMQSVIANLDQLLAGQAQLLQGQGEIKTAIAEVQTGVAAVQTGITDVQTNFADLKQDVKTLLAQAQQPVATVSRSIPSNLPYSATANFIGRQKQLEALNTLLHQENRLAICAVNGMGGIGKTELALQYALRFSEQYPGGLCWLSCRGADVGLQLLSFGRNVLGLPIPEQGEMVDQLQFLWTNWPGGKGLLIYDDVTDYSAIQPYLPPPNYRHFTALLTSRQKPNPVAGIDALDLTVLSLPEALALLTKLAGTKRMEAEPALAAQICEWVGCLPLALELLGAYLAKFEDRSLAKLWEKLQVERLNAKAFQKLAGGLRTIPGVLSTFELSWEVLSVEAQALAVRLSLFASAPFRWQWVADQLPEPEEAEAALCEQLMPLSWLQRVGEGVYELHPLLREYLRLKQSEITDLDSMKRALGAVMVAIAQQVPPTVTLSDLAAVEMALPHLAEVAEHLSDWLAEENYELIWPFTALGRVYKGQSQFTQAEKWLRLGVETCKNRLGDRHPHTATSYNNLAELYRSMGRYEEALPLYQLVVDIFKEQLGDRHPDTATFYNNLAGLYYSMGRNEEALPLYQLALDIRKEQLGDRHPFTATSYNNLAGLYESMGRYEEALPLFQLVVDIFKEQLGDRHPDTATSYNNLAGLYYSMGRNEEALPLYQLALEIRKEKLGEDHPDVAGSLFNLAALYHNTQRPAEALEAIQCAIQICTQTLGRDHPTTQAALIWLQLIQSAL